MGREITWDTVAQRAGLPADLVKEAEIGSVSGNPRRVAEFSWTQLRHSAWLNGTTDIALTFADYLDARNRGARRFGQLTRETIEFIEEMEAVARAPVSLISAGFFSTGRRAGRARDAADRKAPPANAGRRRRRGKLRLRYGPLGAPLVERNFDAGLQPGPFPGQSASYYQAPRRLPGSDFHRQATTSVRSGRNRWTITS
jgi:hypothetical protein